MAQPPKRPAKTVEEIWQGDALGRRQEADFLIRALKSRADERKRLEEQGSYVLNIDARWGSGKTYFLNRLGNQLSIDGYLVISIDAWEDDHASDPLLPFLAAFKRLQAEKPLQERIAPALRAIQQDGIPIPLVPAQSADTRAQPRS